MNQHILIVDDERSIRRSLKGILDDEGFRTVEAESGEDALRLVASSRPALVLLDIWLQGMDGMEVLKEIKSAHPDLPVIMISGHATISSAVQATRLGAIDFLEKPLDLHETLRVVRSALTNRPHFKIEPAALQVEEPYWSMAKGKEYPQRTIAKAALLYGEGLHSGKKSGLNLEPLPANSGIHFRSMTTGETVPAMVQHISSTGYATTVRRGTARAGTIEHLLSALHAYGITNLLITCNDEIPVMDGSALPFCQLLESCGVVEQEGTVSAIRIAETIRIDGKGGEFIQIEPAETFEIDYTLRYPAPLGEMKYHYKHGSMENYKTEISPNRTFAFMSQVGELQNRGLAQGGKFNNFVLFGETGPLNTTLRFDNEPARHKVLDAIGDLYLLNRPLQGKVTACMTGHSDNIALLKKICERSLS